MSPAVPSRMSISIPGCASLKLASSIGTSIFPGGKQRADRDLSADQPVELVDLAAHAVDLGDHGARPRRDRVAGLGRGDAAARALEQLRSELGLEAADLVRERRLRDVKLVRGAGEVAVARDRLDVSELAQLHRRSIVKHD